MSVLEPLILNYLTPAEVVKSALEGIDKDLNLMDYLLLAICVYCANLLLRYFQFEPAGGKKKNLATFSNHIANDSDLEVLGFKISKRHGMNLILILTFIHFLLGLSIQSKTSLIVEYAKANNCTGALFKQYDSVAKMELVYTNPAADSKACAEIHKLIAEKFAFQTLQGSKLYQLFNYHKMFLSDHDTIAIGTYIILAIPFLLFSCGFYIIFTVWSFMFKNKTLINHRTKIKWAAFTLFYLANILIIYMWVDGVRNACEMDGFIFKLHPPQNLFPFLHYFFR